MGGFSTFKSFGSQVANQRTIVDKINYIAGLKWKSYDGYHDGNVNYSDTASLLSFNGTSDNFQNLSTANNNVFPNAKQDYFTIEWLGYFLCDITGSWTFTISDPDDGIFLWIDNDDNNFATSGYTQENSINNGGLNGENRKSTGSFNLTANKHYFIKIIYGEFAGAQNMTLTFTNPDGVSTNGVGYLFSKN
jgi:hypothetical protein